MASLLRRKTVLNHCANHLALTEREVEVLQWLQRACEKSGALHYLVPALERRGRNIPMSCTRLLNAGLIEQASGEPEDEWRLGVTRAGAWALAEHLWRKGLVNFERAEAQTLHARLVAIGSEYRVSAEVLLGALCAVIDRGARTQDVLSERVRKVLNRPK